MIDAAEWDWLRGELPAVAARFGRQLRTVADPGARVPNLAWSVAELGRHVASLPHLYRRSHEAGRDFVIPDDWPTFSAGARAHITATEPGELADLVESEAATLVVVDDPAEPRWLYGRLSTAAGLAAGMLVECVLHGQDLGRLTGDKPRLTRRQALAAIPQQMAILPVFVDPRKAARLHGTYGLRFRGGDDYTYRIDDTGRLVVELGRPERADARMIADPAAFISSSLGRSSAVVAALTGRIVAYGRKPWRLAQLGDAAIEGV